MTVRKQATIDVPAIMILLVCLFDASEMAQSQERFSGLGPGAAGARVSVKPVAVGRQPWNWYMQSTIIGQGYPSFGARYSGSNSLPAQGQARETASVDFYGGYRLWNGVEFHIDVLSWQGFGLHGTLGIDDFTNGEAYKVGTRYPHLDIARFFVRQTIGLGGEKESVPSDQLALAGERRAARLALTAGRFSSKDIFDSNTYANDPRKQFSNWALVANAAWDYPADSLGYTTGVAVEADKPKWSLRYGFFQLPNQRNGFTAEAQFLMWPGEPAIAFAAPTKIENCHALRSSVLP